MRCPCAKKSETRTYASCCKPYHDGTRVAPTPEALMRSRYSAYATEKADYLAATWHPTTRPDKIEFGPGREWVSLKVVSSSMEGDRGTVEFVARSRIGGQAMIQHELSRFVREAGRWLYVDGDRK